MRQAVWLCALLPLASCNYYNHAVKTYSPEGKEAYVIQCQGGRFACAEQAGDLCGTRGYAILDQSGQMIVPQPVTSSGPEVMIACKDVPPRIIYRGESGPRPAPAADASAQAPNVDLASKIVTEPLPSDGSKAQ